jgi:hypothetical protein
MFSWGFMGASGLLTSLPRMRSVFTWCWLALALAIGAWSGMAHAQLMPTTRVVAVDMSGGAQFFQLTGSCTKPVAPGVAVILGGMASSALKPVEAIEHLDEHLKAIKDYIEENHGRLRLLERVRMIANPPPNRSGTERELPFQVVQRLQAEFAADAPVDGILQRLIELGLDRFGDNVLNTNGSRREAVILFRFADFDAEVRELQKQCVADAWKDWCGTPGPAPACSAEPPAALQVQAFTVRSAEKLLRPDGGVQYWQSAYTGAQRGEPLELMDNLTVHLSGTILLTYRVDKAP